MPDDSAQVVTRFAPSPTGALHVGGARTALFNWAFARQHKGQFIIRIEDTDQARSTPQSTRGILEDLKWLGIDWDQGPDENAADPYASQKGDRAPYFQSQRVDTYRKYCDHLISCGRAYECFRTKAELDAEKAAAAKGAWKYDRSIAVAVPRDQREAWKNEGKPYVVRFHTSGRDVTINDQVLGDVVVKAEQLEDFVIFKGDGFPTYHFAVVVDDALMGVTHVIRAQEHLINTAKHIPLQEALGFAHPTYAHLPLIFNMDATKMSKRDKAKVARAAAKAQGLPSLGFAGIDDARFKQFLDKKSDELDIAVAIAKKLDLTLPEIDVYDFRRSGYLPQVLLNYVALLGWNPGGNVERFELPFLIEKFSFSGVGKSNSKFDREKLKAFNGETLRALSPAEFEAKLRTFGEEYHPQAVAKLGAHFGVFAGSYRERCAILNDPFILGRFFFIDDDAVVFDAKAVEKVLKKDNNAGVTALRSIEAVLAKIEVWEPATIHAAIDAHGTATGQGMGNIAQPCVAVTGSTVSPAIHDTLAILGKAATLKRIARSIALEFPSLLGRG